MYYTSEEYRYLGRELLYWGQVLREVLYLGQSPTLDVVFGGVQVLGEGAVILGAGTGGGVILGAEPHT